MTWKAYYYHPRGVKKLGDFLSEDNIVTLSVKSICCSNSKLLSLYKLLELSQN